MTRAGFFIVRLDMDTGQVLRIEKQACAAKAERLGDPPAEREVCGSRGYVQAGHLWLCRGHFETVLRDAEAQGRTGQETVVGLDACVFPDRGAGRSATLCGEPAAEMVGGAPACELHYGRALRWHQEMQEREWQVARDLEHEARRQREAEMQTWAADGSQIVYYLRRADGAVKIGTTAHWRRRFSNLKEEHGILETLLTHCGDRDRENEMHGKFTDLALGREWFRAEEPLLSWISWVRRRHINMRTLIPGTMPLRYILALQREERGRQAVAADPAA